MIEVLYSLSEELDFVDHGLPTMMPGHEDYVERVAFDIGLVLHRTNPKPAVLDIGGGFGLFSLGLAAVGARSIIADDFAGLPCRNDLFRVLHCHGVEVIQVDLLAEPLPIPSGSLDAVTNFHFLEHLHHSPRGLFHRATETLRPGGIFVVAGPNCANARKRLYGLVGRSKWTTMKEWYETPVFRGHVREPDVADLRYIVDDLGFAKCEVYGRNYLGRSHGGAKGLLATMADPILRLRPTLCSDIYAVGS